MGPGKERNLKKKKKKTSFYVFFFFISRFIIVIYLVWGVYIMLFLNFG